MKNNNKLEPSKNLTDAEQLANNDLSNSVDKLTKTQMLKLIHQLKADKTELEMLIKEKNIPEEVSTNTVLKKSEEKYNKDSLLLYSIFESSNNIIVFSLDKNYCYTAFTKFHKETIKNIWGVDIQIGTRMLDVIANHKDRRIAKRNFDLALKGESFVLTEEYGDNKLLRGSYENHYNHIKDTEGNIIGLSVFVIDATSKKQALLNLVNSEKRFYQIINQSQAVIWEVDANGLYTYVSLHSKNIWGYEPEELIGKKHFYDLHPKEGREEFKLKTLEFFQKKTIFRNFSNIIISGDGKLISVETNGTPILDNQGNLLGYLGSDMDITYRKMAEKEIKDKTTLLTNLIINLQEGILLEDSNREIVLTNQLFCKMFGIPAPPEALIGSDCSDSAEQSKGLFKNPKEFITDINKILADKKTVLNSELELVDGRFLERDYIPTYLENEYSGHLWKYRDITERKLAEKEIHNLNINLEQKIKLRTTQLAKSNINLKTEVEERKKIASALAKSFDKLHKIANLVPGVVYQYRLNTDGSSCFPYASDGVQDIYRVSSEEIIHDASVVFTRIHPDDLDDVVSSIQISAKDLTLWRHEYRVKFNDGTIQWLLGNAMPQKEADGTILWHGLISDFTERKKAEDELAESREKHRGLSEAAFDSIFFSEKGICIEQNQMAEKMFGYTNQEAIGRYGTDWIVPEDRKRVMDNMIAGYEFPYEATALKKDGTTFPCVLQGMMINYKGRNVRVTSLSDITERKEAENKLKQTSTRLALATRAGGVGVWEFDVATNTLLWDDQMFILYGIKREDFGGAYSAWQSGLHPDDRLRGDKEIQLALSGEKEFDTEFRVVWPNGTIRFIKAQAIVQRDQTGKALCMVGTNWDITVKKRSLDFEYELLQLSLKLTGIPNSEISSAIDMALNRIGSFLTADRAYIFEINHLDNSMNNTYEWCNVGIQPEIQNLQNVPCSIFPKWMETLLQHENILIPSVKELPHSWNAEREILEAQDVKSLIVIPIINESKLIGFVGLDFVLKEKKYDISEITILKVWSNMLQGLLNNQRIDIYLDQTRKNYETFFNTIDDFLFVLNEEGNIIFTNQTVVDRLGYSSEELRDKSVLMVHPAERREEAGRIVGEMLAGTTDFCPVPLITKSDNYIPVETRVKTGFWNGNPVIFGVSKDISKIQLSEEKFSKAFQSNSALMAISGFDNGIYIDVNDAFLKTLEYTREEVIGKSSVELNLFVDKNARNEITKRLNPNIPSKEIEIDIKTKSGNIITGLFSVDTIFIGNELCLLTVMINISDRKQAEKEINRARNEAEEANLAKSEYLSRMSHELRTPMNSILGFAQLLELGNLNQFQKKSVGYILGSGKHLLNLINEVLDISLIESGKISLSIEPVKLSGIINETIDIARPLANERQLKIIFIDTPCNSLFVKSDHQRLKQVLLNLINNGIKYNNFAGSLWIKSELIKYNELGKSFVRISITDSGLGISPEDTNKLFQPFERIGAEKTKIEGSGLGLPIVKKLTEAMGGNVGVYSEIGKGSTFWIELPHCDSVFDEAKKPENNSDTEIRLDHKFGKILYIEDNLSNVELVEQILYNHRPGIEFISDINGKKTLGLAIEHKPDLILLDLDLPDIHGSKVINILINNEDTKKIPVVIISADATSYQLEKLLMAGASKYVTKPIDIIYFLSVIDEYIISK